MVRAAHSMAAATRHVQSWQDHAELHTQTSHVWFPVQTDQSQHLGHTRGRVSGETCRRCAEMMGCAGEVPRAMRQNNKTFTNIQNVCSCQRTRKVSLLLSAACLLFRGVQQCVGPTRVETGHVLTMLELASDVFAGSKVRHPLHHMSTTSWLSWLVVPPLVLCVCCVADRPCTKQ